MIKYKFFTLILLINSLTTGYSAEFINDIDCVQNQVGHKDSRLGDLSTLCRQKITECKDSTDYCAQIKALEDLRFFINQNNLVYRDDNPMIATMRRNCLDTITDLIRFYHTSPNKMNKNHFNDIFLPLCRVVQRFPEAIDNYFLSSLFDMPIHTEGDTVNLAREVNVSVKILYLQSSVDHWLPFILDDEITQEEIIKFYPYLREIIEKTVPNLQEKEIQKLFEKVTTTNIDYYLEINLFKQMIQKKDFNQSNQLYHAFMERMPLNFKTRKNLIKVLNEQFPEEKEIIVQLFWDVQLEEYRSFKISDRDVPFIDAADYDFICNLDPSFEPKIKEEMLQNLFHYIRKKDYNLSQIDYRERALWGIGEPPSNDVYPDRPLTGKEELKRFWGYVQAQIEDYPHLKMALASIMMLSLHKWDLITNSCPIEESKKYCLLGITVELIETFLFMESMTSEQLNILAQLMKNVKLFIENNTSFNERMPYYTLQQYYLKWEKQGFREFLTFPRGRCQEIPIEVRNTIFVFLYNEPLNSKFKS